MFGMLPRVLEDPPRPLDTQTREHVVYLFRRTIRVVRHAGCEDAGAHDNPLTGYLAWNPFNVVAFRPVDFFHARLGRGKPDL